MGALITEGAVSQTDFLGEISQSRHEIIERATTKRAGPGRVENYVLDKIAVITYGAFIGPAARKTECDRRVKLTRARNHLKL